MFTGIPSVRRVAKESSWGGKGGGGEEKERKYESGERGGEEGEGSCGAGREGGDGRTMPGVVGGGRVAVQGGSTGEGGRRATAGRSVRCRGGVWR